MKYLSILLTALFLTGCLHVAETVEAPTDITKEESSVGGNPEK